MQFLTGLDDSRNFKGYDFALGFCAKGCTRFSVDIALLKQDFIACIQLNFFFGFNLPFFLSLFTYLPP
jgi:hypothetical protein